MLYETEGLIITAETTTGEVYSDKVTEAENSMNSRWDSHLQEWKSRPARKYQVCETVIRGKYNNFFCNDKGRIRMLPTFKNMGGRGGTGAAGARGKSGILRGQAGAGGRGLGRRGEVLRGDLGADELVVESEEVLVTAEL